ncbi:response regulator transcription factor [Gorillibacterium sp. sgz5001074]|uniref:response regulator transcription factor n=1 Tax=Gorillibacterium sp. sgz5001074 TaxID=3446695 RepID=UPI003F66DC82
MYHILIADDEPLICKGLENLLSHSGLSIGQVFTAASGYEALDLLRMEEIHLLVTDIQMGEMNGIELMQQAKLIKPWVQTIIISAHETFQYAQMAIRLGAKDYLIKPLNSAHFLDSVRDALLKSAKPEQNPEEVISGLRDSFRMNAPDRERSLLLGQLLEASPEENARIAEALASRGVRLSGPYYSVLKIKLRMDQDMLGRAVSRPDGELLQYGALNIICELLDKEWDYHAFHIAEGEIGVILEWSREKAEESGVNKVNQLDMIGRSLHHHINRYLNLGCVIGISQLLKGLEFMGELSGQAGTALLWSREHADHDVFYYGDYHWGIYKEPSEEELAARNNLIVEKAKTYIRENYAQKGLTLHEVAQRNHVSPNYLSYLFKKYTSMNLWEYVIKLRMEEGKRLLQTTDLRRYEIAELVGYESPEHFSKIFKKYFGVSLRELKK